VWDNNWYAGHHVPGYSLLFEPLAAVVGLRGAAVLAILASSALFALLARRQFAPRAALVASVVFALAASGDAWIGRLFHRCRDVRRQQSRQRGFGDVGAGLAEQSLPQHLDYGAAAGRSEHQRGEHVSDGVAAGSDGNVYATDGDAGSGGRADGNDDSTGDGRCATAWASALMASVAGVAGVGCGLAVTGYDVALAAAASLCGCGDDCLCHLCCGASNGWLHWQHFAAEHSSWPVHRYHHRNQRILALVHDR